MIPLYVGNALADVLNDRMSVEDWLPSFAASVGNEEQRSKQLLLSYPEVVNYPLKKFAAHQAISEKDTAIPRYIVPPNMTPHQYADNSITKSCMVSVLYY